MKLDKVANSGNDEFYTPEYAISKDCIPPDHVYYGSGEEIVSEWINPLIELVPVEEVEKMSEFEEEFNNCLHFGFIPNEQQNKIIEHFKYWQPPKPLVVVPEITQKQADTLRDYKSGSNSLLEYLRVEVKKKDYNRFARAWIDGYTVEKEKKYILKHIDMSKLYTDVSLYLAHGFCKELDHVFYKDVNVHNADECHFTQSEIDKLNIGSYEKIPVEMSDNGI